MSSVNVYVCFDDRGMERERFSTFDEAEQYAQENRTTVIEEEYTFSEANMVSDYTKTKKRFTIEIDVTYSGQDKDYVGGTDGMECDIRRTIIDFIGRGILTRSHEALEVDEYTVEVCYQETT